MQRKKKKTTNVFPLKTPSRSVMVFKTVVITNPCIIVMKIR